MEVAAVGVGCAVAARGWDRVYGSVGDGREGLDRVQLNPPRGLGGNRPDVAPGYPSRGAKFSSSHSEVGVMEACTVCVSGSSLARTWVVRLSGMVSGERWWRPLDYGLVQPEVEFSGDNALGQTTE